MTNNRAAEPASSSQTLASARDELTHWVARGAADEVELQEGHHAMDGYRSAVLNEIADTMTIREATPLWDAVNNILLRYGFCNPASSVAETEKLFELFREHLRRKANEADASA